jgi:hypothetical protein
MAGRDDAAHPPLQRHRRSRRRSLYGLRRLPERPKKRLPHAFPIAESGLSRDDFDRVPGRLADRRALTPKFANAKAAPRYNLVTNNT